MAEPNESYSPFNAATAISLLLERAGPALSADDCRFLNNSPELARDLAQSSAEILEALGQSTRNATPFLLYHFANVFQVIEGLIEVSLTAGAGLHEQEGGK